MGKKKRDGDKYNHKTVMSLYKTEISKRLGREELYQYITGLKWSIDFQSGIATIIALLKLINIIINVFDI